MPQVRVAMAQIDTVVGDLAGNVGRILAALRRAEDVGSGLCVFPELAVTGYPPEDLLLKPGFVADTGRALAEVARSTGRCAAVVGFVDHADPEASDPSSPAVPLRLANAAALCCDGRVHAVYQKRLLPNYGVFDEARWFVPGSGPPDVHDLGGIRLGISICEDVWAAGGPVAELGRAGADLVVNLNASPYSIGRPAQRVRMLAQRAVEAGCAIAYVNQVGGQDELVFDGASMVVDATGELVAAGRQFAEDLVVADLVVADPAGSGAARPRARARIELPARGVPELMGEEEEIYAALVLGTRDYLAKNGFTDAVLGLSGGIDSALVATVAVDAIGPGRVHALSMPSRYSSEGSRTDAAALAAAIGVDLRTIAIESAHQLLASMVAPVLGTEPTGLTDENLQSRLRGLLLMTVSNATGAIVLTTGNKSELATGYSTLYGDSAGGFAVIKDVPKTLVYRLCRYRNQAAVAAGTPPPIPLAILEKAPSAELRPDQRDDESLPPYHVLDPVLAAYVEQDRTAADLRADGFAPDLVAQVVRLVDGAEYKRRQMPPGVRITEKAFGRDRRMPITNHYREAEPVAVVR